MYDCAIIGGGPAGLTAATYLGRFRRRTILLDGGDSRLRRVPLSRNVPGFPAGVSGLDLLERLQSQADAYGVERRTALVGAISPTTAGFVVSTLEGAILARTVLLATGVDVTDPEIDGLEDAIARGLVRYCPICDGYETQNRAVAVLGGRAGSIEEARFLTTYTRRLTFIPATAEFSLQPREAELARREGIEVSRSPLRRAEIVGEHVKVTFENDRIEYFDSLYPCLGSHPRSKLLIAIGGKATKDGGVLADEHQRTNVEGFFAAGDVLKGVDQIASAFGQAAVAACAIHNRLREGSGAPVS
jgi:thioredoxin reductase (NADPH)